MRIFVILLLFFVPLVIQDAHSQYMDPELSKSRMAWYEQVETTLQENLESNFYQNPIILQDSIKTKISGGLEDVLPPFFHVRILFDEEINGKIIHRDSIFKVDFELEDRKPTGAKLVEVLDMEYKPPRKTDKDFAKDHEGHVYWMVQNIMCRQGFEKIEKISDGSPACVKPDSIPKLIERGWVKSLKDETETSWVVLVDSSCSDPWDREFYREYSKLNPNPRIEEVIFEFYEKKDVKILDLKLVKNVEPADICQGCGCNSGGNHWHMQIPKFDIDKLETNWYEIPKELITKYSMNKTSWKFIPVSDKELLLHPYRNHDEFCSQGYIEDENGIEVTYYLYGFFRDKVEIDRSLCR